MGFDLYFAGSHSKQTEQYFIDNNYNRLFSQLNDRTLIYKYIEAKKNGWTGKLLIDSGAFSVHRSNKTVDIDEYIQFLNEQHNWLDYYIQVDDIPGKWGQPKTKEQLAESPKKSWQNYLYMRGKLVEPYKLLPVFHQGEDFFYLKQILEYIDEDGHQIPYICISSNKEYPTPLRLVFYRQCYEIIQASSNPNIKVHCLGTQARVQCESFPFTSSDATSWVVTAANGNIFTKWGSMYISDKGIADKSHILNDKVSADILEEYFKSEGFTLDEIKSDYNKRTEWNIHYLGKWSKEEYVYRGPKKFTSNYLF